MLFSLLVVYRTQSACGIQDTFIGLARTVYIYTVFNRIFGDFPARNTVYALYIYGSGQPYTFMFPRLHTHKHTNIHAHVHTQTHTETHTRTHTHAHTHRHTQHTHTHTHAAQGHLLGGAVQELQGPAARGLQAWDGWRHHPPLLLTEHKPSARLREV